MCAYVRITYKQRTLTDVYANTQRLSSTPRRRTTRRKRLVEGRAFIRAHFVLSGREWETKESAE